MAEPALATRAPGAAPTGVDDRGSTEVRDRVFARLARRATTDVDGVCEHGGRLGRQLPAVDVEVSEGRVRARVSVAVAWPRPCRTVAATVRDEVRRTLTDLGGLEVDTVDVTVVAVLTPDQVPAPRRVLR